MLSISVLITFYCFFLEWLTSRHVDFSPLVYFNTLFGNWNKEKIERNTKFTTRHVLYFANVEEETVHTYMSCSKIVC